MNTDVLREIGLTPGEINIYLALLKLGTAKKAELARESKVSSSKVYEITARLEKKGLVGHVIKGKIKHFKAIDPKRIRTYLREKEEKFKEQEEKIKELIPQLESKYKSSKKKTEAALFEGFEAIKNFYKNLLLELQSGDEYHVLSVGYGKDTESIRTFFDNYHRQRAKKGIRVKMLANHGVKLEKSVLLKAEIRYLPQYLINDMIVNFYKDKAFIFFLKEEPVGFLLESKEVVSGFQKYFDVMWKIAKK